jgi:hypothetical protein
MALVRSLVRSRRTVVSPRDEPKRTETLVSRRGRTTKRPRERSSRCVPSTLEVRAHWAGPTREKRRVSRPRPNRDVSRPCCGEESVPWIFCGACSSRTFDEIIISMCLGRPRRLCDDFSGIVASGNGPIAIVSRVSADSASVRARAALFLFGA